MHIVTTRWVENRTFDSAMDGHTIRIDGGDEADPASWPSPKRLLLSGLAGCSGMDVVEILEKMRQPLKGLEMVLEADLTDEHPIVYSEIRFVYRFRGDNLDPKKVLKAVKLSQEKYCGVTAMLAKNCPVIYSIEYPDKKKDNEK